MRKRVVEAPTPTGVAENLHNLSFSSLGEGAVAEGD